MSEFLSGREFEPKTKLSELLRKYMAGDSHEHTVFSNPPTRREADYTFEQVFVYIREEMAEGENAMEFVIFAEHPSDAGNPQKVNGQALLEHQNQIHAFMNEQETKGIECPHLISGLEVDIISGEGEVNVPSEVLSKMDIVIASKHGGLEKFFDGNPNAEQLTKMYLALMQNPDIDVIGHPNRYVEYSILEEMNWDSLLSEAKKTNTALEININAPMPEWLIKKVVQAGVPIFIGTDAHTLEQYQNLPNEVRDQIENPDDRLKYPLGLRYNFWKQIAKILRTLEATGCPSEQIITSSYQRLNSWLSKEKSERIINFQNART